MRTLVVGAASVAVILLLVDVLIARPTMAASSLATDVIDIQTPAALVAKTRNIAAFRGQKVILLGDSLVAGQVMREHGDPNWRQNTLSAVLQNRFDAVHRDGTLVINLGMNGILPADIETLANALLPLRPDMLVIDISLRSFSRDFALPDTMNSRAWLKTGFKLDQAGGLAADAGRSGLEAVIDRFMLNTWTTYRMRDLVRARFLGGAPRDVVSRLRSRVEGAGDAPVSGPAAEMRLLLQVRGRYATSSLDPDNPQFAAWVRLMRKLRAANQKTIVFYATESPRLLPSLMDSEQYVPLVAKLKETVEREGGPAVTYLEANRALTDDQFLDHVHVDKAGNEIYGASLFKAMSGG